jgi:multimeric flavodoxin WrbA
MEGNPPGATASSAHGKTLLVIDGGPRASGNTATLIQHAAEGARAAGARVEQVALYQLDFKGCRSCFACKLRNGKSYGQCAQRDDLTPVLASLDRVDALLLGSPIYLASVTGEVRSFLERLLFPLFTYTDPPRSLFSRQLPVGVIYTMGIPEERTDELALWPHLAIPEKFLGLIFNHPVERLASFDTFQFDEYSKYVADRFDPVHKANRRREVFPKDCAQARALGAKLVS